MNLKKRIIISIGLTLFFSWLMVTVWIWHETNELKEIMVDPQLTDLQKIEEVNFEIKEIFVALTLPTLMIMCVAMVIMAGVVNRFLQPFTQLAEELQTKSDLDTIDIDAASISKEADIIVLRLNQLLQRINQRIDYEKQFTADVAHELRTPLAGMRLNIELLEDIPEKVLLLDRIDSLLITIERLLQFARASYELHANHIEPFDINKDVIQPLVAEYEGDFPHPIRWSVPSNLSLKGDSSLIYLLLKNLLDNVKFYAKESQETIVSFSEDDRHIVLQVMDNGPGIDEHLIKNLTQRYTRVDESRVGSGLGLNLVERIVFAHNAQMMIENRHDGQSGLVVNIFFTK